MKVALLPNLIKQNAQLYTQQVINHLLSLRIAVFMQRRHEGVFEHGGRITFYDDFQQMLLGCDIIITIGGDGTIIHMAKHAAQLGKPLLGINLGRVGFVAGLELDHLDKLELLVTGEYQTEKRTLLSVTLHREDEAEMFYALNEAVVSRGSLSKIIDLNVSFNNSKMCQYQADGLIFATPTGSTAYSLAAGGPVIEPTMRCLMLTPICSHSLFSRSVVFSETTKLSVQPAPDSRNVPIFLTVDGETSIPVRRNDSVEIELADLEVTFIKLKDQDFYRILNEKLSGRGI